MKGRKHRETGGFNAAAEDLRSKNEARTNAKNIDAEAEEKAKGGRAKKEVKMEGKKGAPNMGRKPRKQGGGTFSDSNPYTSARRGTPPSGRKLEMEME